MADKQKVHPEKDDKKNVTAMKWIVLILSIIVLAGGFILLII